MQHPLLSKEHTECIICKKLLGFDSRSEGHLLCHEHRVCNTCGLSVTGAESKWCLQTFLESLEKVDTIENFIGIEIIHVRCKIAQKHQNGVSNGTDKQTRVILQSEYDLLNIARLMVIPDMELSQITNENNSMLSTYRLIQQMDLEQLMLHEKMLEACLAEVRIAIKRDPKYRKEMLAEREKEHASRAKKEATASSKPVSKTTEDPLEIQLASLVELHGLNPSAREQNLKILRGRNKTVKSLMASLNLSETQARQMCDKSLLESGVFKR